MGKKLTVYLINGNDDGPRTIEIGNWSGKALYSPRVTLKQMMKRNEYDRPYTGPVILDSTFSLVYDDSRSELCQRKEERLAMNRNSI